jgi:hypothetical protein
MRMVQNGIVIPLEVFPTARTSPNNREGHHLVDSTKSGSGLESLLVIHKMTHQREIDDTHECAKLTRAITVGFGVRTLMPIQRGQFVMEYAGEVISTNEARERYKRGTQKENRYEMDLLT